MANQHHSREEVTKAINNPKANHPGEFLSKLDKSFICNLFEHGHSQHSQEEGEEDDVLNLEEGFDSEVVAEDDEIYLSFYARTDLK